MDNQAAYIEFIEKTINVLFSDHLNDPELFDLVTTIDSKFNYDEKKEVLTWRNILLRQVKSYTDNNLNSANINVIDSTKDNFTQPLSIK